MAACTASIDNVRIVLTLNCSIVSVARGVFEGVSTVMMVLLDNLEIYRQEQLAVPASPPTRQFLDIIDAAANDMDLPPSAYWIARPDDRR